MKSIEAHPLLHLLDSRLWTIDGCNYRSTGLTPLFIDRYSGPRMDPKLHTLDYWMMLCVFSGRGQIIGTSQTINLKKSSVCLIPPGIPYAESSVEDLDALWVGPHGSMLDHFDKTVMHVAAGGELAENTERLWLNSIRRGGAIGPELDGLALVLLGSFQRHLSTNGASSHNRMEDILLYINTHYANDLNVGLLATKFGCSEGYFHREFKKYTGQTPVTYITSVRIKGAVALIQKSTLSLKRIGQMTGFSDLCYFSRIFKQITGHSPKEFRRSFSEPSTETEQSTPPMKGN